MQFCGGMPLVPVLVMGGCGVDGSATWSSLLRFLFWFGNLEWPCAISTWTALCDFRCTAKDFPADCERLSRIRESANKKLAGSGARRGEEWGGVLDSSKPDFPKAFHVAWYSAWYGAWHASCHVAVV